MKSLTPTPRPTPGPSAAAMTPARTHGSPPDMTPSTSLGPAPALAVACTDKAADVYTLPTGLPAMDRTHRGDVFRCAVTESLTADKVNAQINGYYATTRDRANAAVGLLDLSHRLPHGAQHADRGRRAGRRRQRGDPARAREAARRRAARRVRARLGRHRAEVRAVAARPVGAPVPSDQDFPVNLYALAGYGYTVIAPDYSGFSYGAAAGLLQRRGRGALGARRHARRGEAPADACRTRS